MASFPVLAVSEDGGTENIGCWQGTQSSSLHHSETSKSQSPPVRLQSDEISSSGDEPTAKVRKPYTITKQRERWSEEEHQKFLEALKMHGRAWRRIEEHIGTKTAVQIRSHAQKFFSKLERDASARGIPVGKAQDISIPPPRPKRKPSHPYPRKAGTAIQSSSSIIEEGGRSPLTVSSVPDTQSVGLSLGGGTHKSAAFAPYNARTMPLTTNEDVNLQETKMESSSTNSSQSSLKLFGQTVMVPTIASTLGYNVQGALQEFYYLKQEGSFSENQNPGDQKLEKEKEALYTVGQKTQTKLLVKSRNVPGAASYAFASVSGTSTVEGSGESNTNVSSMETGQEDSGNQTDEQPCSELDNKSNCLPKEHQAPAVVPCRHVPVQHDGGIPENAQGFVKYGSNAVSLAHEFAAMSMLNGNSSLSKAFEQLQADIQNSSQTNFLLPFPGIPGPLNLQAYNNLENLGCIRGFVAAGTGPSGPSGLLGPWNLGQFTALQNPAYAAATLAAMFWPGLASGFTAGITSEPLVPTDGQNGLTHEETKVGAAITAATVAAASAWWTLHGAVLPSFLHPCIYGPLVGTMAAEAAAVAGGGGYSLHAYENKSVMGVKNQEQAILSKAECEILDAISINPHADAEGEVTALQQLDDGKPSKLKASFCAQAGSVDCLLHGSPTVSEDNTAGCKQEFCNAKMQVENQNSQTEEQDHKAICTNSSDGEKGMNKKYLKERSSSGSNTPSSTEPEMDPYFGTDIEAIKGDNEKDFKLTGKGSGSSEAAVENAGAKGEEAEGCILPETVDEIEGEGNNPLGKQDKKMDNGGKHVHKDRYQGLGVDAACRRSKCGGHVNDTWKAVSEEGRIAFQALFTRDVLPQSFSPPHSPRGYGLVPKSSSELFLNDAKQSPRKSSLDEMQVDSQNRLANQMEALNDDAHLQGASGQEIHLKHVASSSWGKKIQSLEVITGDQSLEVFRSSSLPSECADVDFNKPIKSLAIPSFRNFRSGLGFVPYQRCSMDSKKNRLHMRPIQNFADDIREEKRIRLKQEVKE